MLIDRKHRKVIKHKSLSSRIKSGKEFLTFRDIETKKNKF